MPHQKDNFKNNNVAYFKQLLMESYPQRLQELESLHHSMLVMDEHATLPQIFVQKLINEINTLWRAEEHYWQKTDNLLSNLKFPKDYIVRKQQTISDLITHLHSLLLKKYRIEDRKKALNVLSDYIEIEYKLNGLLIEKEKRMNEISDCEIN